MSVRICMACVKLRLSEFVKFCEVDRYYTRNHAFANGTNLIEITTFHLVLCLCDFHEQ